MSPLRQQVCTRHHHDSAPKRRGTDHALGLALMHLCGRFRNAKIGTIFAWPGALNQANKSGTCLQREAVTH